MGDKTFLGPGLTIDTKKKFTIVTQFITSDGTANGDLSEIRRLYVQDGKVVENSQSNWEGIDQSNSISDKFCAQQKGVFGDNNYFAGLGGLKSMGDAIQRGMVLALSLWDDHSVNMLWLDSDYPPEKDASAPGVSRGPCATSSGEPTEVESQAGGSSVIYSNIKWGDIGPCHLIVRSAFRRD